MPTSPHEKIIARVTRQRFRAAGLTQKGRSRLWLGDHGWWLALVELQPSAWARGTYLNVGAMWLLYPQDHHSFHLGHRQHGFVPYSDDAAFELAVDGLCTLALERVAELRRACTTTAEALARQSELLAHDPQHLNIWHLYYTGVFALLSDRISRGLDLLQETQDPRFTREWERQVQANAKALLALPSHEYHRHIRDQVREARTRLKLEENEEPLGA